MSHKKLNPHSHAHAISCLRLRAPAHVLPGCLSVCLACVCRAVMYREGVLLQLRQLVSTWPARAPPKAVQSSNRSQHGQYPEAVRVLRNLSK